MDFKGFIDCLAPYKRIALTAPSAPDGDSVGTQSALKEILEAKLSKDTVVRIINEDPCPWRYGHLSQAECFEESKNVLQEDVSTWPEVMICVDGGHQRVGEATTKLWEHTIFKMQVDHHKSANNDNSYDFRLHDPKAPATTVIVHQLMKSIQFPLTASIAHALYIGLIFDTGMFKHSNTTPEIHLMAAELLATGFNHTSCAERAIYIRSKEALDLSTVLLSKIQYADDGKLVYAALSVNDFSSVNATMDDREGLIDFLFLTKECVIAILMSEIEKNVWKVSFRSKGPDVAALAQSISPKGGGHHLASGCALEGTMDEALEKCKKGALAIIE